MAVLTREGLQKLQDELDDLQVNQRAEVVREIETAKGFGDLSENAEYDAAKDEQAKIEARIREIENMLKNKEVIRDKDMDASVCRVNHFVFHSLFKFHVTNLESSTDTNHAGIHIFISNDLFIFEHVLNLSNSSLDFSLLIFSSIVLSVL